MKNEALNI